MPDAEGYPTEDEIARIREWSDIADARGWLAFVKSCWWSADWGWTEFDGTDDLFKRPIRVYLVSTGGWSGNEEIIGAMRENVVGWSSTWHSHRRGGHYEFRVARPDRPEARGA